MKKGTAVFLVIMVSSFVLSLIFMFVSVGLFAISGTKELAENICSGDWDEWSLKYDGIEVDDGDVKIDLPGLDVVADDEGVDVDFLFIHVHNRDVDENKTDD